MKIIDINGKEREVLSIKRVAYEIRSALNGEPIGNREYVEVVIQGKTGRTWKEWYPIEDFKEKNPNIVI